jgi:hypothetical protein
MFDKVQRDRFWLLLGAVLIALFVVQKERGLVEPQRHSTYDRGGMTRLVERTIAVEPASDTRPLSRPASRAYYQTAGLDDPHGDIVTGSVRSSGGAGLWTTAPRPLPRPAGSARSGITTASLAAPAPSSRYYVQLGAYSTIDRASRRYFDVLGREPDLRGDERVSIDSVTVGGEQVHRVRMGAFRSEASARAACARASISADECAVVALN